MLVDYTADKSCDLYFFDVFSLMYFIAIKSIDLLFVATSY